MLRMVKQFINGLIVFISLAIISCSQEEPTPEVTIGALSGTVTLFDKFENELENQSGITVEVLSGNKKLSTTTDMKGKFSIKDAPFGKLIVNFKKENFRGFDSLIYNHKPSLDSLNFIKLAEFPPAKITLWGMQPENGEIQIPIITEYNSDEVYSASLWLFFGKSPQVSSSDFIIRKNIGSFSGKTGKGVAFISLHSLQHHIDKGFKSGDRVYVRAYPGNSMQISYNRPEDGYNWYLFPTFGNSPSNMIYFTLP